MVASLRRRPIVLFYFLAFAWTCTYVIFVLIVFPLLDSSVRLAPGDRSGRTARSLGYLAAEPQPAAVLGYSAP